MADVKTGPSVFLIGTKTKLVPSKPTTIAHLELNAALLLSRWLGRLRDILSPQLNIIGVRAWSDSMIVLSSLKVPSRIKMYVLMPHPPAPSTNCHHRPHLSSLILIPLPVLIPPPVACVRALLILSYVISYHKS